MKTKIVVLLLFAAAAFGQTYSPLAVPAIGSKGYATVINNDLVQLNAMLGGVTRYPTGVFTQSSDPTSCLYGTDTALIVSTAVPLTPKGFLCGSANVYVQVTGSSNGTGVGWTIGVFASLPATCPTGAGYFATDKPRNQQLYTCYSTNLWVQIGLLDGSGFLQMVSGALGPNLSIAPELTSANSWQATQFFPFGLTWPVSAGTAPGCTSGIEGQSWPVISGGHVTGIQACVWNGTTDAYATFGGAGATGDYYQPMVIPAANQNAGIAGNAWSIPSTNGCVPTPRTGTNNNSGTLLISSTTSCQFQFYLPLGWDTAVLPYLRINLISSDVTNAHTIIPAVALYCANGSGSNTDDGAFNTAQTLSTTTLNGTAFRLFTVSTVQFNSTSMTGAVAGSYCNAKVTATGTATDMEIVSAVLTMPVKLSTTGAQ